MANGAKGFDGRESATIRSLELQAVARRGWRGSDLAALRVRVVPTSHRQHVVLECVGCFYIAGNCERLGIPAGTSNLSRPSRIICRLYSVPRLGASIPSAMAHGDRRNYRFVCPLCGTT